MRHKYVNFDGYGIVVWPMSDTVIHADIARCVGKEPVSAGFVHFTIDGPMCVGESISLRLKSSANDTAELRRQMKWPVDGTQNVDTANTGKSD